MGWPDSRPGKCTLSQCSPRSEQVTRFASIILTNGKDFLVIHMLTVRREQKVTTIFAVSGPYILFFHRLKKTSSARAGVS
jgi:hypothetical protein